MHGAEDLVQATQDGFRPNRSMSQQLYCIRRILKMLERGGGKGAVVLLDWAKAFDRVKHDRLWEALRRHGVPATLVAAVQSLNALL